MNSNNRINNLLQVTRKHFYYQFDFANLQSPFAKTIPLAYNVPDWAWPARSIMTDNNSCPIESGARFLKPANFFRNMQCENDLPVQPSLRDGMRWQKAGAICTLMVHTQATPTCTHSAPKPSTPSGTIVKAESNTSDQEPTAESAEEAPVSLTSLWANQKQTRPRRTQPRNR